MIINSAIPAIGSPFQNLYKTAGEMAVNPTVPQAQFGGSRELIENTITQKLQSMRVEASSEAFSMENERIGSNINFSV